jgi:mono/diheme cytochrome c family protein
MHNLILFAAVLAAAALFAWFSLRLGQAQSRSLRWLGTGVTGLIALTLFLICAAAGAGFCKQNSRSAAVPELKVEGSAEDVQRGKAVAESFCGGCHSRTLTLTGGFDVGKDLPLDLGSFFSSNLTPAGSLKHWSDGQIFRAIRNGIDADGHWLVIMSLTNAGKLSDDDVRALIAYIRSLPAAGTPTPDPPDHFNFLGLVMLGVGQFPSGKPVNTGVVTAPLKAPTIQYGEYILSYQDCRECHGQDLNGGVAGQLAPIGPGLSMVAGWSRDEFIATFRTGKDPSGHALGDVMPWPQIGKMDDVELSAMYEYLTHMLRPEKAAAN